jgi:hypothetical protein
VKDLAQFIEAEGTDEVSLARENHHPAVLHQQSKGLSYGSLRDTEPFREIWLEDDSARLKPGM